MLAINVRSYGNPNAVLELVDVPEPDSPGASQVVIAVAHAPINQSDLLFIAGNEGVGVVAAVGSAVANVAVSDRVLVPRFMHSHGVRG